MLEIKNQKLRWLLRFAIPLFLIPICVAFGTVVFDARSHLFISLSVAMLSLALFFLGIEKKSIGARRMVIVSVMVALSVIGRLIPFFKPITAITIITAVYLGSEAGFLTGALSALISNFYFGQGTWTPFQMLAFGLIGFFAAFLSGFVKKSRGFLIFYGVMSGILYSLIMDVWNVISYNSTFNLSLYCASVLAALPHTLLYSVSNFIFLWFMAKPFGEKLERIKIKYGV